MRMILTIYSWLLDSQSTYFYKMGKHLRTKRKNTWEQNFNLDYVWLLRNFEEKWKGNKTERKSKKKEKIKENKN